MVASRNSPAIHEVDLALHSKGKHTSSDPAAPPNPKRIRSSLSPPPREMQASPVAHQIIHSVATSMDLQPQCPMGAAATFSSAFTAGCIMTMPSSWAHQQVGTTAWETMLERKTIKGIPSHHEHLSIRSAGPVLNSPSRLCVHKPQLRSTTTLMASDLVMPHIRGGGDRWSLSRVTGGAASRRRPDGSDPDPVHG